MILRPKYCPSISRSFMIPVVGRPKKVAGGNDWRRELVGVGHPRLPRLRKVTEVWRDVVV